MTVFHKLLSVSLLLLLAACGGGSTKLMQVYKDKAYKEPLKKVLVIGNVVDMTNRKKFEKAFSKKLRNKGIEAVEGLDYLGTEELTQKLVIDKVKGSDFDAVLVTRIVQIEEGTAPDGEIGIPKLYYNSLENYRWPRSERTIPVKGDRYREVRLETSIYDAQSTDLIYGVTTRTLDPKSANNAIDSLGKAVMKNLGLYDLL
ncbi:MAG: hypothetical protein QNK37_37720 [Acidobacteriota bacterium]|nr:hypothetical protein [Acidobacteriota bacterium]